MKKNPLALLLCAVAVLATLPASGEALRFHRDLAEAQNRLTEARGPEAYAALRGIWATWDRADPGQVEEALLLAESSARLTPAVRAYAGLLSAYARMRRGDVSSARAKIRALGYVDRWIVIGPFDNEGKTGFDVDFGPERDARDPIGPGKAYSGKERPVRYRAAPNVFGDGYLDAGALMRPERKICLYATSFVSAKQGSRAPRAISLWVGAAGAFKLFWNGEQVLADEAYRGHDADRLAVGVTLEPGQNNLTLKLCGDDAVPVVSVRLGDARGGVDSALMASNDFAAAAEAAKLVASQTAQPSAPPPKLPRAAAGKAAAEPERPSRVGQSGRTPAAANETAGQSGRTPAAANETVGQSGRTQAAANETVNEAGRRPAAEAGRTAPAKPAPAGKPSEPPAAKPAAAPERPSKATEFLRTPQKPGAPEGPLQAFARSTSKKEAPVSELVAYANYLMLTTGDDPTAHQARDLARRAAEREPSVERLLIASRLAEDRNKQAEWIEKAEKLAKDQRSPNLELLLARAQHIRSGPGWSNAFPFYDRVLELDPDNVTAIRGRVELYNEAGLKRTALSTLEQATARNPRSVNLLNMYATQLRALGRATEASEVEERYSALRFDDRTFLSGRIELARARRDRAQAERWLGRLLEADPDSQWALGLAARTYLGLGQAERAIATYRRALELAPEDVSTLRTLADTLGELGRRDEQLATLREILRIRPQERAVREYVEQIEPPKARTDEAYAWDAKHFLKLRHAPAAGNNRRTLRDLTVTTVYPNGLSSKFRQVAFQPLTDAAAAMSRQYGFQYQADREVVQLRGARVYRNDGRIDEAIESGEAAADDPSIAMYTSARNFYVQFPRLEPGDVVELRYRIDDVTPRNEFADYFGDVVYLQSSEPVANAEYVLITPKSRKIFVDQKLPGLQSEIKETRDSRVHRFIAPRVLPLVPEPSMPAWPEVAGFVHVSTYESWQKLGRWYWGLAKDQFDLDDETRKLAHDVAKDKKTDIEKVRAVYNWVVKNTRYVALELGIYGYKPRRCVQTVSRGWGDCKDKATVLVTLLKELGIPSTIVILRTQQRGGFRSKLPSLAPFDHAIVYVPSLDLYLDGTAEYHGSSELPRMDAGALGLHVNQGDAKLVTLPEADSEKDVIERKINAALQRDGSAKLDIEYRTRGTSAAEWRREYHADATRRDRIGADLGREFPGFSLLEGTAGLETSDLENLEQPVEIRIHGKAPGFARREGDQLHVAATTGVRLTPRYASLSQRTQDVRILGFATQTDTFTVKLPPGTRVVSAPAKTNVDGPFGSYRVDVEQQAGQVVVKSRLLVRARRITPAQYPQWQKFCAAVDRVFGAPLVIGP